MPCLKFITHKHVMLVVFTKPKHTVCLVVFIVFIGFLYFNAAYMRVAFSQKSFSITLSDTDLDTIQKDTLSFTC